MPNSVHFFFIINFKFRTIAQSIIVFICICSYDWVSFLLFFVLNCVSCFCCWTIVFNRFYHKMVLFAELIQFQMNCVCSLFVWACIYSDIFFNSFKLPSQLINFQYLRWLFQLTQTLIYPKKNERDKESQRKEEEEDIKKTTYWSIVIGLS